MRKQAAFFIAFLLCASVFCGSVYGQQNCDALDRKQLREKLVQLGYEVKDIVTEVGKEKYSVTIVKEALDIPVGCEISGNLKYIWLTVNLGNAPTEPEALNNTFLKQNAKIQPSFFYITELGKLMMGLPVNNLGVTNAYLRDRLEAISGSVGSTKKLWQR